MSAWEMIRQRINQLAETNPKIHIKVVQKRPVKIIDQEAVITEVYPNLFRVNANGSFHSVQYTDVLTRTVQIAELDEVFREIESSEEKNKSRAGHRRT